MKRFFLFVFLPLIIFGFFFVFSAYKKAENGFEGGSKVTLHIDYGTPVKQIVKTLVDKEVISSEWSFLLYLHWYNATGNLQAGDFILKKGTAFPILVEQLSNAHPLEIPVRILEGNTIEEIDALLVEKSLIQPGEFIQCTKTCHFSNHDFVFDGNLEGFLFPDTYFVEIDTFKVQSFIDRLLTNFEQRFLTNEVKVLYKSQGKTLQDIVIMASIIEKEDWHPENMPIISGILWKRLAEGIPLGADATTRYFEGKKTEGLTTADFQKNNKYNTRRYTGLPPTAISNPGLSALNASLNPEKTKYYYYLHDSSGMIHYAETNDEHNQNKYQYIR